MTNEAGTDRVVVLNPVSGSGDHAETVRKRASLGGFEVRETEAEGDAAAHAKAAAENGASLIAAAGGDGTLNEVVRGVTSASALDRVTVGVVPVGTGNNFAGNVGITGVDAAFQAFESGRRRDLDLGWADDRPFVNSCVGGLTADASDETTPELKSSLGTLAYVLTTLQSVQSFDQLELSVTARDPEDAASWAGEAICVLVGNARRFTATGSEQADVEDGRFEVTIVEDVDAVDLVTDAVVERLLDADAANVTRLMARSLDVVPQGSMTVSLDGETITRRSLSLDTQAEALEMVVGDSYEPDPPMP